MITADAALFQARSFLDIGQPQRAIDVLSQALEHEPGDSALLAVLSRAYLLAGDSEAATAAAHASQNAAGGPVLQAMVVLIKIAADRGDFHQVCQLARAVVQQWPEVPNGHIWYALGLTRLATTDSERATVRRAVATALELGQRSPDLLLNAAWIESRFGDREATLAYVDEGLETDPSHADLLKLRAWAVGNARYSAKVLMGILAIDPFDTEASTALTRDVERQRGRLLRLLYYAPFVLAGAVILPPVAARAIGLLAIAAFLVSRAVAPLRYLRTLPESYRRLSWRGQSRPALASTGLTLLGTALFAADIIVGPFLLAAALALWLWLVLGSAARETLAEPADSDSRTLALAAHTARAWAVSAPAVVFCTISWICGAAYLHRADAGAVSAPFYTVVLLTGLVITAMMGLAVWAQRLRRRHAGLAVAAVLAVGGVVAVGAGAQGVVGSMTGDRLGHYANVERDPDQPCRTGRRQVCLPEIPTFSTPRPLPSISVPSIQMPSTDLPTIRTPDVPDLSELQEQGR